MKALQIKITNYLDKLTQRNDVQAFLLATFIFSFLVAMWVIMSIVSI